MDGEALLSILIPTVLGREKKLSSLLSVLVPQVFEREDVELLVLPDDRGMTIGEKRNRLVELASGDYVVFVDDDDAVTTDYVRSISETLLKDRPDVLCFQVLVRINGRGKICRYHPSFSHVDLAREYRRKPNHIMAWRRELARSVPFPSIRFGEDTCWADRAQGLAKKVSVLDRTLYTYQYDPRDNSATPRR